MRLMQNIREINKKYFYVLLIEIASTALYPLTNRPIGIVRDLTLPLDAKIPLIKEFLLIYHISYPFMYFNLFLFLILYKDVFLKGALAIALGNVLAFFTFSLYQTEVPRPDVLGNDLFSRMLRITYENDMPYNGFPSLHILTTTITLIAILSSKCNKGYKVFSTVLCVLIFLSTLFVKQHTLLDVVGGMAYGSMSYIIVSYAIKLKPKNKNI